MCLFSVFELTFWRHHLTFYMSGKKKMHCFCNWHYFHPKIIMFVVPSSTLSFGSLWGVAVKQQHFVHPASCPPSSHLLMNFVISPFPSSFPQHVQYFPAHLLPRAVERSVAQIGISTIFDSVLCISMKVKTNWHFWIVSLQKKQSRCLDNLQGYDQPKDSEPTQAKL